MSNTEYCGQKAPSVCVESRKHLLGTLKQLANELDKGCCDECCRDSPFKRRGKQEEANPCLGVFPPRMSQVPPGVNPNRRGRGATQQPKVTMDGREVTDTTKVHAEEEFDRYPSPPWFKPRDRSQELRGGFFHIGCDCYKRNGLQDDCPRSECGTYECISRPPACDASTFSPHTGVRIPNMQSNQYHNYNLY
ncbi:uncharacterized protein LOC128997294 [Macrosteles quadrilineatus]|uniref:uncharacterized protein LOC128997294 n=1 Tax=Macrosteles quadrilineatus TaxID=74068 RepID=UPI0023E1D8DC|nr:uncharacterized protein LOC128997294 [Macrosteles quadrilineatus]